MREVLEYLGAVVEFDRGTMTIDTTAVQSHVAPYDLVQKMRASIQIMGPLVARFGHARVAMPGGCNLGPRKIDIHLRGLAADGRRRALGPRFCGGDGADKLHAVDLFLDYPSVGATENLLMAGGHGGGDHHPGERCPRAGDQSISASSWSAWGPTSRGRGAPPSASTGWRRCIRPSTRCIGDRIEAGTFLIMGAVTGGDVEVNGISPHVLDLFLSKLRAVGRAGAGEHAQHPGDGRSRAVFRGRCGDVALSRVSPPICRRR